MYHVRILLVPLGDLFQKQKIKGSLWNLCTVMANLVLPKCGPRIIYCRTILVLGPFLSCKKWSYHEYFGPTLGLIFLKWTFSDHKVSIKAILACIRSDMHYMPQQPNLLVLMTTSFSVMFL